MATTKEDFSSLIKQSLYSAKISSLLAQENISVEFSSSAHTASYNPFNRTICFPYTTAFMDKDVHEMFMFHEVSHALHLNPDDFNLAQKSTGGLGYFNIIIDIRDERLIKEKYTGAAPVFMRAYETLLNQKWFGKKSDIPYKAFPDRLNCYAKLGVKNGSFIPFTADESQFYDRCMKARTMEECIELSDELSTRSRDYVRTDEETKEYLGIGDEIDFGSGIGEDDENEMTEEERQEELDRLLERLRESRVQEMFDANFKDSILNNANILKFQTVPRGYCQQTQASAYVKFVKDWNMQHMGKDPSTWTLEVREMRRDISMSVDSMVRVFESKKAAERVKNARISDTGLIDANKAFRYKFDDKIFRRSMRIPNSKNHAYFLLVDFSGSMHSQFQNVIEQIMVITEFLRRIQVPYKIMAFGQSVHQDIFEVKHTPFFQSSLTHNYAENGMVVPEYLFEMMNSEQTTFEHNIALTGMRKMTGFGLGSTPTIHAVEAAEVIATNFFDRVKADRKHLVVITDGEPTDRATCIYGRTNILVDSLTQQSVVYKGNAPYSIVNAIGKLVDKRHNIKFTTLSVTSTFVDRIVCSFISSGLTDTDKESFRRKGYAKMMDPYTNNPIFFAKPFHVDTGVDEFSIKDKTTTTQIARALINNMKAVNKSRNFLNALAESLS